MLRGDRSQSMLGVLGSLGWSKSIAKELTANPKSGLSESEVVCGRVGAFPILMNKSLVGKKTTWKSFGHLNMFFLGDLP